MNPSRLLAIKVGNSNLRFGIFEGENLAHSWRMESVPEKTADEYAAVLFTFFEHENILPDSVHAAALVSVVPALEETMRELCDRYLCLQPFIAGAGIKSGIEIKYDDPRALGADRLVSLVAARQIYGSPLVLIDLGTATTFNALDAQGNFVGGAIAPGLNMSARALHHFTAKLPLIESAPPPSALATNTHDALRSGIFFGYAELVGGMVLRLKRELQEPTARVVATGGLAKLLAPHCPAIQVVDQDLAMQGLRILHEMNQ